MCDLLQVSRSGYYAWRKRPVNQRKMASQQLLEKIKGDQKKPEATRGHKRDYTAREGFTDGSWLSRFKRSIPAMHSASGFFWSPC
jgi:putative transposase